jgi:hypothetical protein
VEIRRGRCGEKVEQTTPDLDRVRAAVHVGGGICTVESSWGDGGPEGGELRYRSFARRKVAWMEGGVRFTRSVSGISVSRYSTQGSNPPFNPDGNQHNHHKELG